MRASIIIPAYGLSQRLYACLRSLDRNAICSTQCEVIVVLNEAGENERQSFKDMFPCVKVVNSRANLGVAGSGNRGRYYARGENLILLHDDTEVEPGWLDTLLVAAESDEKSGAVGSMILNFDFTLQGAGSILWSNATTSPPWIGVAPPIDYFADTRKVDYCGTSSLLIKAWAWDTIGGLDERFYPAYYVDVDVCMALRRFGLNVLFEPRSRIRHWHGASTSPAKRDFIAARNRLLFIEKWGSSLNAQAQPDSNDWPLSIQRALNHISSARSEVRLNSARPEQYNLTLNLEDQDWRHVFKERELCAAYVSHLDANIRDKVNEL